MHTEPLFFVLLSVTHILTDAMEFELYHPTQRQSKCRPRDVRTAPPALALPDLQPLSASYVYTFNCFCWLTGWSIKHFWTEWSTCQCLRNQSQTESSVDWINTPSTIGVRGFKYCSQTANNLTPCSIYQPLWSFQSFYMISSFHLFVETCARLEKWTLSLYTYTYTYIF